MVVRREEDREVPDEAVAKVLRRMAAGAERPDFDVLPVAIARIEAYDDAAAGARARRARPDDVRVDWVRRREPGLAAQHAVPLATLDRAAGAAVARSAIGWAVLPVAVDVVRHPRVDGDVVHLRDRQVDAQPAARARRRD